MTLCATLYANRTGAEIKGKPAIRPDGRMQETFDRIEAACAEAGLPFRRPTRTPNTRRALETAEWVRVHHSAAFPTLHRALFRAQFVTGEALDDADVLDRLVTEAGAPAAEVRDAVNQGDAAALVAASMHRAREAGVLSTPTWLVGELVIPGALDSASIERWVRKILARNPAG